MKFELYTDISVPVYQEVEAESAEEAIKIAENNSRLFLYMKGVSYDETLGYCMLGDDVENLPDELFEEKYGVPKHIRY